MSRFPLHELDDAEFEDLVTLICREILGAGVTDFAEGKDGGKDAKFVGMANCFPSRTAPASGKFIIQAKHTSFPASCSDSQFKTQLRKEFPKILKQFKEGTLTHYLLFTNRRKSGGAEEEIPKMITKATGVENVWLRGLEDIERELLNHPSIVSAIELDKLRLPIQFTSEDIRDVIIVLHKHKDSIESSFDSQYDFQDYPGLKKKNQINNLSDSYDKYIRDDSMKEFPFIKAFLENPRNVEYTEQYHAVADELKGQIILHKARFSNFDTALEQVFVLVHQRSPELQPASKRKLSKTMVHYMYVNCDIGDKE